MRDAPSWHTCGIDSFAKCTTELRTSDQSSVTSYPQRFALNPKCLPIDLGIRVSGTIDVRESVTSPLRHDLGRAADFVDESIPSLDTFICI